MDGGMGGRFGRSKGKRIKSVQRERIEQPKDAVQRVYIETEQCDLN